MVEECKDRELGSSGAGARGGAGAPESAGASGLLPPPPHPTFCMKELGGTISSVDKVESQVSPAGRQLSTVHDVEVGTVSVRERDDTPLKEGKPPGDGYVGGEGMIGADRAAPP